MCFKARESFTKCFPDRPSFSSSIVGIHWVSSTTTQQYQQPSGVPAGQRQRRLFGIPERVCIDGGLRSMWLSFVRLLVGIWRTDRPAKRLCRRPVQLYCQQSQQLSSTATAPTQPPPADNSGWHSSDTRDAKQSVLSVNNIIRQRNGN